MVGALGCVDPESGSTYCWSPADPPPPPASAAAGTSSESEAISARMPSALRQERTGRVLQQSGLGHSVTDAHGGAGEIVQTLLLQDLLHGQGGATRPRRRVLGCSPPAPEAIVIGGAAPLAEAGVASLSFPDPRP